MTLRENFCNYISAVRDTNKLTLAALSEDLQISRSSLQDIVRGKANPRLDTVEHIANRLNIDPIDLLTCSSMKEQLQVAVPLLYLVHTITDFTEDKMQTLIKLLKEMLQLFQSPKK